MEVLPSARHGRQFAAIVLIAVLAMTRSVAAIEFTEEERQFIAEHPTIIVGGEIDWPPMDYVEDGVYKGAAKDYLDEVEDRTGLSINVVTGYSWPELMNLLRTRRIDMVPMMYWTEARGREFNLTNPYITVRHYVFTLGNRSEIKSFVDLHGLTMAIPEGYAHIEYLNQNHPHIRILEVPSIIDAMDAVITGQADAIIENTASMAYYTENHNIRGLRPAFPVRFEVDNVHMAMRKDWPVLRDIVQKALNEISAESTTRIMARWTGNEAVAKTFLTTKAEFTAAERAYLQAKVQLVACINSNRMPVESFRDDIHEGMTADYLTVLSDTLKTSIKPLALGSWHEIRSNFDAGRCDLVMIAIRAGHVSEDIVFTEPYIDEKLALVTSNDAGFYATLTDVSDVRVAVVEGYTSIHELRLNHPDIEFVEVSTIENGLDAVADGELFGLLDYVDTVSSALRKGYANSLKISGDFEEEAPGFSIGIRSDEPELVSAVTKVLETLPKSLHQNIHRKWVAVSIERHTDYTLFLQAALLGVIVLLVLYFRYAEVRKHREEMRIKNDELEKINAKLEEQTDSAMHMAYHDQLTGLANRAKMLIDLDHSIKICKRTGGRVAILFLDLDRFKYVNDSLGHNVGDKLLQAVARRISALLRDTDTLCRLGGDEFVVILEVISDSYSPCIVSQRIIDALARPFEIDRNSVNIGTSIGIAICPDDTNDLNRLIKYADSAMYSAKEDGRNCYHYYHEELSLKATRRTEIQSALRRSLQDQDFSLVLQPIVDLRKRKVVKAEALIRWRHAKLGDVRPDEFIPIAEEFGLIVDIGDWVLKEACSTFEYLAGENCDISSIAVNVSSVEFLKGDVAARFQNITRAYNIRPEQIEIEITERYMLEHGERSESELNELRRLGHTICVDDFGTGYSSLSYMKRLPLNIIKIDRSFTQNIPHDQNDVEISQAIISLSHSLGYEVVAEGVETTKQLDFLLKRACNYAQGYYFSKPVAASDFHRCVIEINERLEELRDTTARVRPIRA
jgi:diguanylate cyclase (GGDEF)-like protein